ncbi:MAG: hypothetical protein QOI15_2848 [Pseudonocardiales bacterium]|jgi:hypothetical protein|nr:hypothetical protein [Pseudonocardiales bacterium]MDT4921946.1 hypothetical protein [Pseudonocardiales bacterium]MDT4943209.1 hypothetical protein [Pseudonocardiales bacterium]
MGDIGPTQQQYEVLPGASFGIDDADAWTVAPRATMPEPPSPVPTPYPNPEPDPGPYPAPDPLPHPEPPR